MEGVSHYIGTFTGTAAGDYLSYIDQFPWTSHDGYRLQYHGSRDGIDAFFQKIGEPVGTFLGFSKLQLTVVETTTPFEISSYDELTASVGIYSVGGQLEIMVTKNGTTQSFVLSPGDALLIKGDNLVTINQVSTSRNVLMVYRGFIPRIVQLSPSVIPVTYSLDIPITSPPMSSMISPNAESQVPSPLRDIPLTLVQPDPMEPYVTFNPTDSIPDPFAPNAAQSDDLRLRAILQKRYWRFPTLYKIAQTGKLQQWWIRFDIDRQGMIMTYGYVDGIQTETAPHIVTLVQSSRNLHQQALLKMRKKDELKRRKDLYHTIDEPPADAGNAMSSQVWDPVKTKLYYPVFVQPKLDGVRCLSRQENGSIHYRTRQNKEYPHLAVQFDEELSVLFAKFPFNVELDGELYIHGKPFQHISGIIRRVTPPYHPELHLVTYCIFGFKSHNPIPSEMRYEILTQVFNAARESLQEEGKLMNRIALVPQYEAQNAEQILEYQSTFEAAGYEGVMIYKKGSSLPTSLIGQSYYKSGKSSNLLKRKSFLDEEGIVVGVDGECAGDEAGCAMLHVQDKRGNVVRMKPMATQDERRIWVQNPSLVLGKVVNFKFQELSVEGIPRFPNVTGFREIL